MDCRATLAMTAIVFAHIYKRHCERSSAIHFHQLTKNKYNYPKNILKLSF